VASLRHHECLSHTTTPNAGITFWPLNTFCCCCYVANTTIRNAFSCDRLDFSGRIVSSPGSDDDVVDDDDDDGATEVQTNFVSSQYFSTITTKSEINNTSTGSRYSSRKKVRAINLSYE
jgi:hypothetical protein